MSANVMSSFGKVRYFLGAQVDVSGLLKDCSGLESLSRLVEQRAKNRQDSVHENGTVDRPDQYGTMKALCETFSAAELALIRKQEVTPSQPEYKIHDTDKASKISSEGRLFLADGSGSDSDDSSEPSLLEAHHAIEWPISSGNLAGVYKYVSELADQLSTYLSLISRSTYLYDRHRLSASSSPRLPYANRACCKHHFSIASAAAHACDKILTQHCELPNP